MALIERAMRAVLIAQRHAARPGFLLADIARELTDRFDVSRSTAFQYARTACDVLGVHYERDVLDCRRPQLPGRSR